MNMKGPGNFGNECLVVKFLSSVRFAYSAKS